MTHSLIYIIGYEACPFSGADVDFAAMCNLASLATEYEGAPIILQNGMGMLCYII
jgi:hypothetical protein